MTGYSQNPLFQKLGMKPGMRGIFVGLPRDVEPLFAHAPIDLDGRLPEEPDYIHLFSVRENDLRTQLAQARPRLKPDGMLWVSWPKARKLGTDLNENIVRDIGLAAGLVDVKVAAIDETWSGLKFVVRLKDR